MDAKPRILIVAFTFPPAPGIGGRRWAKFAKYLIRHGYYVHVITAQNSSPVISEWTQDIQGIPITRVDSGWPPIFQRPHKGIFDSIRSRIAGHRLSRKVQGNFLDRSCTFAPTLEPEMARIIEREKITHVIATGAPFHYLKSTTGLKQKYPQLRIITDFRDMWTADSEITNFKDLSAVRQAHERALEKQVVNGSDMVITVTESITQYFRALADSDKIQFVTLENGYDPDDFCRVTSEPWVPGPSLRIVFTGTLYHNTEHLFEPLLQALAAIKKKRPDLYARISLDFFGYVPPHYPAMVRDEGADCVHFRGNVPLATVYEEIRTAGACLLVLNDIFDFSLSTKFCEYISQKKKILVLSQRGKTADFVENNSLGYWIDPRNAETCLMDVMQRWDQGELLNWNPTLDISSFSLESLTQRLEALL